MESTAGTAVAVRKKPVWSEELDAQVKELWVKTDLSAQAIGDLVGKTRNTILSHLHRCRQLGEIPDTPQVRSRAGRKGQEKKPARPQNYLKTSPSLPDDKSEIVVPEHERRGLEDRLDDQCAWPIGDPCTQDFHYCHHKRKRGSFCEHHAHIGYESSRHNSQAAETEAGAESP
jgi:GcrA cell cycle regulator